MYDLKFLEVAFPDGVMNMQPYESILTGAWKPAVVPMTFGTARGPDNHS
jgi:hypothetical protein